ncbi:MAG: type II secretion system F family protein [bacterium]
MAVSVTQPKLKAKSKDLDAGQHERQKDLLSYLPWHKRVKGKELMMFTSQLSLMLETGHPLNRALAVLAPQVQNPYFKEIIEKNLEQIESGYLFSDALAKYPEVFSPLFISMIKAGESGGFLKHMMKQLAEYHHQREEYLSAIKKALTYPVVLMIFAFLVVCFVIVYVFPKLALFLEGKEALLPWNTRFLMWLSRSLRGYWYVVFIGLIAAGLALWALFRNKKAVEFFENQKMRIPVLNRMLIQFYTSTFLSTLGFLMNGGVPLLEGLMITKSLVRNAVFQKFVQELIDSAEKGRGFAAPFRKQSFLPITVREMVQTGEETGSLNLVIIRLGEHYAQEFRKGMEAFCTILEPVIIVFMGIIVGIIVLSIIIPIFRLSSGVS